MILLILGLVLGILLAQLARRLNHSGLVILYNGAARGRRYQVSLQPRYGWPVFVWRAEWPPVGHGRHETQPPCFRTYRLGPLTVSRFTRLEPWVAANVLVDI